MLFIAFVLLYLAIMESMVYLPPDARAVYHPQILDVYRDGSRLKFVVEHATFGERRRQFRAIRHGEHFHPIFHFVLYVEGRNEFGFKGELTPLERGTFVFAHPNESHDFGPSLPGTLVYHEITFSLHGAKGYEADVDFSDYLSALLGLKTPDIDRLYQCSERQTKVLAEQYRRILRCLTSTEATNIYNAYTEIAQFFREIGNMMFGFGKETLTDRDPLDSTCQFMQSNFLRRFTLAELAEQACMSKFHFSRQFQSRFGTSPIDYLIDLRMNYAKRLLIDTSYSCAEIARKLNFGDPYQFSKQFKKRTDQTPTEFAKKFRNVPNR